MIPDTSIWGALERRIDDDNETPVLWSSDEPWRAGDLRDAAETMAVRLAGRGIGRQSPVLALLPNCIDHAVLILALARLGAIWIAIPPDRRGPALDHIVRTVEPALVITVPAAAGRLIESGVPPGSIVSFEPDQPDQMRLVDCIGPDAEGFEPVQTKGDDLRAIIFTSGTTGPPKGALVTERMLVASACGAGLASDAEAGDRFLLWEPLYHIGGSQMFVLSLLRPVELLMVPRFSASRFWDQVSTHRITKIHYLGGILEILLSQPHSPQEMSHRVRLAFGAGARPEVWRAFEGRFGIALREVYGLTEASSFTTINRDGPVGSIGRPVPWVDVVLADDAGEPVPGGQVGEITIRPKLPGLLTGGYYRDEQASAVLIRGGALHAGDLGRCDDNGNFYFVGRKKDAIRVRGELVSAWEIEAALLAHPDVCECAAVPVPADIGEDDILVFVRPAEAGDVDLASLARWSSETLSVRTCPRYWQIVDDFPRTPSARIEKTALPRDCAGAFDTEVPFAGTDSDPVPGPDTRKPMRS